MVQIFPKDPSNSEASVKSFMKHQILQGWAASPSSNPIYIVPSVQTLAVQYLHCYEQYSIAITLIIKKVI
jgi:hypothetical protein